VARETASGNAFDLPEGTLEAVAQLEPDDRNFAKRLVAQLRTYAPQIAEVMRTATANRDARSVETQQTDAPEPVASPAPTEPGDTPATASGGASGETDIDGFAAFAYTDTETAPPPVAVEFAVGDDESLRIRWPRPAAGAPVAIFRVVTNAVFSPMGPELGETIAATFDTEVVDSRPHTSAALHVTIWLNTGATESAARAAQPVLHAKGVVILPVRGCVVRADGTAVVGQWQPVAEGVQRIEVERVPKHLVPTHRHYTYQFRLPSDMVGRGGFKDTGAPAGGDFVYRIYAWAPVEENGPDEQSIPVAREVRIDAIVEPVRDLTVTPHEDVPDRFDLSWTMPVAGRVEIYRSETPPSSGIDAEVRDRSVIVRQGLTEDLRLVQQMVVQDGRGQILDVPWPAGWARAYFTPVTVVGEDQLQVGEYQVVTRARPLTHVQLVERVDKQFLTFAWPEGVTEVRVYRGPRGGTFVNPEQDIPIFQLNHEEYTKFGGAHLREILPPDGCAVHLVATTYARGRAQYSAPVTVDYPGLCRLRYTLEVLMTQGGPFKKATPTTRRRLVVTSDSEVTVPLVLVHHPERLPLSTEDGQIILRKELSFLPGSAVLFEEFDIGSHTGYVRLFAHVGRDIAHLRALLDPPLPDLRCGA
jgi:hypothetical protein